MLYVRSSYLPAIYISMVLNYWDLANLKSLKSHVSFQNYIVKIAKATWFFSEILKKCNLSYSIH